MGLFDLLWTSRLMSVIWRITLLCCVTLKQSEQFVERFWSPKNELVFTKIQFVNFSCRPKESRLEVRFHSSAACLPVCPYSSARNPCCPTEARAMHNPDQRDTHVLLLMPTGRDAEMTAAYLGEAGIQVDPCSSIDEL